MLKNCKACGNKHLPPFGRYCKYLKGKYCVFCDFYHDPPVGLECSVHLGSTLSGRPIQAATVVSILTNMATRSTPVTEGFDNRDDPGYLAFLEEKFLSDTTEHKPDPQTQLILRRLDLLEAERSRWRTQQPPAGVVGQSAGLVGATGGASGGAMGGSVVLSAVVLSATLQAKGTIPRPLIPPCSP